MSSLQHFGINGRYLTQSLTGVQRYALNVTRAIGKLADIQGKKVPLITPQNVLDPKLSGILHHTIGHSGSHAWEQAILPRMWPGRLLNLCNTAPVLKSDQVVCIHDANVFLAPESYNASFRIFYKTLQPLMARRAARITTVSAFSARQISQHLSINISDIVVLPNGHEHVYAWDPNQAIRVPSILNEMRKGTDRPFIVALGSQARHKNIDLLISMAPELSKIGLDLVIAGGQADIFKSDNQYGGENIKYLGSVTDHDLAYLFERALCLAFPSWTEGFGLPALEAMACGCPVVSTDRASLPEICANAALLASPSQPQQWITHFRALLASKDLREELIGRGYDRAKIFSWTNTAQGYLNLMHSPRHNSFNKQFSNAALPKIAVVIATLGRPYTVSESLKRIVINQSYKPSKIIIACVAPEDAGEAAGWSDVTVVISKPGLAAQRNIALASLPNDVDIVVFFDDDFVPDAEWLHVAALKFRDEEDIVGLTGDVLVDGIKGPGLSFSTVDRLFAENAEFISGALVEPFSPYGCNMAFRVSAIGTLRFDERLVLYGWLEDRDFGAALAAKGGRLVKCISARGIHMGVKSGRIAGDRLGYSQIINPLYMLKKGTMTFPQVIDHLFRNFSSNIMRAAVPEPYIDRRGRLRGNLRGILDIFLGRIQPERALRIRKKSLN